MNENPEGTPNPLGGSPAPLDANPSENNTNTKPEAPARPVAPEPPVPERQAAPEPVAPVAASEPVAPEPIVATPETTEMKAPAPEKSKKKTGLIIGLIVLFLALIGGGLYAAYATGMLNGILGTNGGVASNPVSTAVMRLLGGDTPENVSVGGAVSISTTRSGMGFKKIALDIKSDIKAKSLVNASVIDATVSLEDFQKDLKAKISEAYPASKDLYFKVDGIADLLEDLGMGGTVVDCDGYVDCAENPYSEVSDIDGEWFRISASEIKDTVKESTNDKISTCMSQLTDTLITNRSSIGNLYKQYEFVSASTENIPVAKKANTIYKVSIDADKLAEFVNTVNSSEIVNNYYTCLGTENTLEEVDVDDIKDGLAELPAVYVEVDNNYHITRFYTEFSESGIEGKIDLSFSYPASINVAEPSEYKSYKELLNLFNGEANAIVDDDVDIIDYDDYTIEEFEIEGF